MKFCFVRVFHHKKNTNKLKIKEIERLVKFTRSVLIEAIEAGGSSLKDHRQTNGELGYFQHNFAGVWSGG